MKERVLFVCIHNSGRSQMAEAFLNRICGGRFEACSAGLEPGSLNPIVVEVMREVGIDISRNRTKGVATMLDQKFAHVITVCDEAGAERCPIFSGSGQRHHWGFSDPSSFRGTRAEKLAATRGVRDAIESKIGAWCREVCNPSAR